MAKHQSQPPRLPPCYAHVLPGLEDIAAEEVKQGLAAEIKKKARGTIVFRPEEMDRQLLHLRTTEDIFLLAWGSDELTLRALDLKSIERWTARDANWDQLLQIHHAIRPKPSGKPTYRLVTQMNGRHVYRRIDARKALAKGLQGKLPASWKHAEENASIEIWLTIDGKTAVCGVRLSDRTMRHRTYKQEHIPASLRPTMAAAMVRLARLNPGQTLVDPFCGAGTILAEQMAVLRGPKAVETMVIGGDRDLEALRNSRANLVKIPGVQLACWDARHLPFANKSIPRVISNPPFGKQLSTPEEIGPLYRNMVREINRVLLPEGRVVLLVSDFPILKQATLKYEWHLERVYDVRLLGQKATISVWNK